MAKQLPDYTGRQIIFVGTTANDGTGDSLRNAFIKANDNFDVLYGIAGLSAGFKFSKLYETPDTYIANTLVTVNEFADGLVYRTAISDDIMVEITPDEFKMQLAPILSNNISFMGDTVFSGKFSINSQALNLAANAVDFLAANGAGLYIGGANATLTYQSGFDAWASNKSILPAVTSQKDLGAQTRKWNNLWVNNIQANTIVGALSGTVSDISNHTTDDLIEGQVNRYYTVDRENSMKSYVGAAVTNLIGGAPGVLDTLGELAAALGNNTNFATTLTNSLALKANIADVTASFTSTTSAINSALALKANTTDVNASLALKANLSDVTTSLNSTTTAINSALALKANTTDVNASLALKANLSDVTTSVTSTTTAINSALALKANIADVNTTTTAINNELALKANTIDVNTTITAVYSALSLKANSSSLATVATSGSYNDLLNKPTIAESLPSQTGNTGKYLTTNGSIASWANVAAGLTTVDDIATNASYYPVVATTAGGSTAKTSSTKFYFNPSSGTLNATTFNSLSDRNFKTNIAELQGALDIVNTLDGVSFMWKETGARTYGIIAQDVETILPNIVHTNSDGIKSVEYHAIIPFLIEAIKELTQKVSELEKK